MGERPKSPWTPSYSVTKQGPNEETEELDKLEQLPGPVASIPELATDEVPISPVLITETRASVDGYVTAEAAQETPQTFPILEGSQKTSKKSVHPPFTSPLISDSMCSGPVYLLSTSSTPQVTPMSLSLPPSALTSLPPMTMAARDWSPQLPHASFLVDGSPLRQRFLKRAAHPSTSQLENLFLNPQLKTLQPLPSPLPSRKTERRSLVGAQSCEGDLPQSYASKFLKFTIIFIISIFIFILILMHCLNFLYH